MGETQENSIQQTSEQDLWQEEAAMMHIFSRNRKNNLRTLLSLFKGHYGALVGSIFFFIIKHSPTWVLPIVTANIINAVTDHNGNITKILILNTILMIAFLVQNIPTNYIHTWLYAKTVRTVEKELREALVCKLQQLSITYHKEMQSGRLQSKIMRDVEQIQNLASQIFISLLTIILNIGVSFGVVIFKSRIVFLFFLCTIPVSVLIIVGFKGKIKTHNRAFRKEMEETSAKVMEMVEMIPVTKAHALEDQEARKMSEQLRKVAEKGLQLDMIQTYFSSISWVAFQIFQVFCLAFTAYIAWKGIIGVGDITLYQTYFSSIVAQIASIVTLLPIIAKGLESVESIGDVLCANDIEDNCRKKKVVDLKGEITFQDVSFTYNGNEKPVLSHLNFKIQPGETVAFAGGSGSGKTTILNLAIGFLKADSGQVLVDGNDLMELDLHSYRKQIAVVPQQSILFTGTLRENITYGSESISEEQLWNVIRAANLEEVVQKLPDGLDTMITEHGENLSGGQRQRISIARAFLRNPKILILDEATSALDSISEKKIQDSIQKLVKGRTTLIVAHRLSTIRNADRIAVIEKGYMEPPSTLIRVNGRKGIGIGVSTAPDYDVVKAGEAVRLKLAQLEEQMPVGIEMVTLYPEDQIAREANNGFILNLIESVVIVIFIILIVMGVRAGILIGQGKTMQEAMDEVHMVVEGVYSAKAARRLAAKYDVPMPIVDQVNEVLFEGKSAAEAVQELMLRDKTKEANTLTW